MSRIKKHAFVFWFSFFVLSVFAVFWQAHPVSSAMVGSKPIRTGNWCGKEIDYLAGEIIIKLKPDADSSRIDSLLEANELSILADVNIHRWGLMGCDTSDNVLWFIP